MKPVEPVPDASSRVLIHPLLRSRAISILHLLSGSAGVALIMLASFSLAARTLGPREFGALAIILAIGRVCERMLRFESWQPLIRYTAIEETKDDPNAMARLYAYGLLLDLIGSTLSTVLTVAAGYLLGSYLGLADDQRFLVTISAVAIFCNIRGMPSAALRMAGWFRSMAYVQLISGGVRLLLSFVLFKTGGGLTAFVIVWTFAQIVDALIFNLMGFRALAARGIPNPFRVSWRKLPTSFPGFLHFAFSTNLSSMMRTLTHEGDTLLVGFVAGPASAGAYHLARRIAKVAMQSGEMIQAVIYPDLARSWSGSSRLDVGHLVKWLQIMLAAVGLTAIAATWLVGAPILGFLLGPGFNETYYLLLTQLVAVALMLHASPSRSALLAMNRPGYVLQVAVIATIVFYAAAAVLMPRLGALGASVSHIVFGIVTAAMLDIAMWRQLARSTEEITP